MSKSLGGFFTDSLVCARAGLCTIRDLGGTNQILGCQIDEAGYHKGWAFLQHTHVYYAEGLVWINTDKSLLALAEDQHLFADNRVLPAHAVRRGMYLLDSAFHLQRVVHVERLPHTAPVCVLQADSKFLFVAGLLVESTMESWHE